MRYATDSTKAGKNEIRYNRKTKATVTNRSAIYTMAKISKNKHFFSIHSLLIRIICTNENTAN